MKKTLLPALVAAVFFYVDVHAQNCSVTITGGNCTGTKLIANTSGGELAKLAWYNYSGNVYSADTISSPGSISVVAGNHGTGAASNQFGFPSGGVSVDASGNVYVADAVNNRIQKWAPGAVTGITVAGGNGQGSAANQLSHPRDVFVDADGNIYVADVVNHRIQKWTPGATSGVTVAGGNGEGLSAKQLNGPRGVYVDNKGNIYIADTYNYRIQKWKPGAGKGITVAGGKGSGIAADQLQFPIDVYLDAAKNVYIADAFIEDATNHRVQKWAPGATSGITVAGNNGEGSAANQFGFLLGIYVDDDGTVYATDNGVSGAPISRVQKWTPGIQNGITVAGGHSNGWDVLSYPTGIALDKNGSIYVFDGVYNPRVQKYIPTNGIVNMTFTPTQPGSYSVQAVLKNGCIATSNSLVIRSVPEKPVIYATQPKGRGNLCDGGIDTFFVYKWDDITNYTWQIPPGCSLISNHNDSVIIAIPAAFDSANLKVKGSNICGTSQQDIIRLTGKPLMPGNIKGQRHVFANQTNIVYSINDVNSMHHWNVPAGAVIQSGQGTSSISVNWGAAAGIISVNSYNDCGASLYKEIQVSLKNSFAENIANATGKTFADINDVFVFPNPAKNMATIKFNSIKPTSYTIELQNMNGLVLMQRDILAKQGSNNIAVDISKYASGLYLINIKNSERKISLKLTKE